MRQNTKTSLSVMCVAGLAVGVFGAPASAQVAPGFIIENYANVDQPRRMSFDPATGDLYVGQGDDTMQSPPINRVRASDRGVESWGSTLFDADSVFFDATGAFTGTPGAVIVGSGMNGLWVVNPDQSVSPLVVPLDGFVNPTDFIVDSRDELIFTDYEGGALRELDHGALTVNTLEGGLSETVEAIEMGPDGSVYTANRTGEIRLHDTTSGISAIVRDDDEDEREYRWMTAADERPGFADGLLIWDAASTEILLFANFDFNSEPVVVGSGFRGVKDLAFGPDGALYVSSDFGEGGSILRLTLDPVPAPGALAALGGFLALGSRRRR